MKIKEREIEGVYEILSPPAYVDDRGLLVRMFDANLFKEQGIDIGWLQQSLSYTKAKYVLRGLHLQLPPFSEAKLITILDGEMHWVVVDVRKGSATFGEWDAVTLSPESIRGLLVKRGFAHGCVSLTSKCSLVINADNYYSTDYGIGIAWDDPDLGIEWPIGDAVPIISDEHRAFPSFDLFKARYGGI